jgi:undecaprenyl diphosphate synthase
MSSEQEKENNIPRHIAIIPDGNRRWAKRNGLSTTEGHKKGADNFGDLFKAGKELGVKYFSTWAFSTENWKRPEEEMNYLFDLIREFAKKQKEEFLKEKTRFIHLGRKDRLPKDLVEIINDLEEETKHFTDYTAAIGIDYGGHDELIRAFEKIKGAGLEITEENIEKNLDTADMPPPDLIIRTSGEQRLSGFMSWQCAYSEFYFAEVHYPDFDKDELIKAVEEYKNRKRTYGGN